MDISYKVIEKAYNDLIYKADSENDNILYRLSNWLCDFLDEDKEKILYYSLPIWNYVSNSWDSTFPLAISKINEKIFNGGNGWYKNYQDCDSKKTLKRTTFGKFTSKSGLSGTGFSFVEFITQNATSIGPIFSIEFLKDNSDKSTHFKLDSQSLKLYNNNGNSCQNIALCDLFIHSAFRLLSTKRSNIDTNQKNDLINLYTFLCAYQKSYGYDIKYIYLISSRIFKQGNRKELSSGGLILVCKNNIEHIKLDLISIIINLCYRERGGKNWAEKCKRESIKSAVSAIMSRNMSHNLGSHYLYYTKVALDELADKNGHMGPYIRGAAKVLSYIQGRMDYLATIVSNDKYPYGSVNFKSQILDELTIDDFSKRHYGTNPDAEFKESFAESVVNMSSIKELVDELSAQYTNINLQSNDIVSSRKITESKIESILLLFKQLDKKSIYNRTTNYLLTNLIKSENYSRPDILEHNSSDPFRKLYLFVSLWNEASNKYELFTGANITETMTKEIDIKDKLSKINLALPGGTMSCHAFYNIIENFIRNSAKYSWTDYHQEEDLRFTIALKISANKRSVKCVIYDNKHDALRQRDAKHKNTLLDDINSRLSHLRILDDNNMVDKENKGLKEMLFSAVWLKANEYDISFAEIISEIENSSSRRKLSLISQYGFDFIGVDNNGEISNHSSEANLGLSINLPLFTHVESLQGKSIKDLIKLHTDVIEISSNDESFTKDGRCFSQIFPRIYYSNIDINNQILKNSSIVEQKNSNEEELNAAKLKQAIISNLGNVDDYILHFASVKEPLLSNDADINHKILFDTHFSTQASKDRVKEYYGQYAYVDTISGNNFTKTLQGLFYAGLNKRKKKYKTFNDLFLSLKIKESALTRITIIDERLFNNIRWEENIEEKLKDPNISGDSILDLRMTSAELTMKNIRILNFLERPKMKKNICYKKMQTLPFLYGNSFLPLGPCSSQPNACHFLSIHLGLIEKLLKSKRLEKYIGPRGNNPLHPDRIENLMALFERRFGEGTYNGVHICVHSGRGNFSKELEGPLKKYPFISLAALENSFNNSKYLLSQIFYNTIFIGKGEVNH